MSSHRELGYWSRKPCSDCDAGYSSEACGRCFDCCWNNPDRGHGIATANTDGGD